MGGDFIFKWGDTPWGASVLVGGIFEKNCKMGGSTPHAPVPPLWETLISELILCLHQGKFMDIK